MSDQTAEKSLQELWPSLNKNYRYLSQEEVSNFLEHGWIRIPKAMNEKYVDRWMGDLFVRMGMDEHDKSTWDPEYQHLPRHREVPAEEFCPEAWNKIVEICGGGMQVENDRIDLERETWYGDAFIVNLGSAEKAQPGYSDVPPAEKAGWHIDDDWYRLFLDSGGTALTLIHCFTDIPEGGGGTWLAEDGIAVINDLLYNHPEGFDPPIYWDETIYSGIRRSKRFTQVVAKKGDIFVTHGRLPHTVAHNLRHYARVITNPHVSLREPMDLNRADGNFSLVEQVVLNSLGRTSIPEYKPGRERKHWYPRNQGTKRPKADVEVQRMEAAAVAKGLPKSSVNSFYQKKGSREWAEFEHRNGFDKEVPPSGMASHGDRRWIHFRTREESADNEMQAAQWA